MSAYLPPGCSERDIARRFGGGDEVLVCQDCGEELTSEECAAVDEGAEAICRECMNSED